QRLGRGGFGRRRRRLGNRRHPALIFQRFTAAPRQLARAHRRRLELRVVGRRRLGGRRGRRRRRRGGGGRIRCPRHRSTGAGRGRRALRVPALVASDQPISAPRPSSRAGGGRGEPLVVVAERVRGLVLRLG